ncbi:unnamed protein product [Polarella glacialis]|uniref:RING-type domain-containing protein n=1 Tax=Polarella glacialis TaxID=89957 RepID=A0A813JY24_POLGL|nr:unnamed protein product [Polarella glacialis]
MPSRGQAHGRSERRSLNSRFRRLRSSSGTQQRHRRSDSRGSSGRRRRRHSSSCTFSVSRSVSRCNTNNNSNSNNNNQEVFRPSRSVSRSRSRHRSNDNRRSESSCRQGLLSPGGLTTPEQRDLLRERGVLKSACLGVLQANPGSAFQLLLDAEQKAASAAANLTALQQELDQLTATAADAEAVHRQQQQMQMLSQIAFEAHLDQQLERQRAEEHERQQLQAALGELRADEEVLVSMPDERLDHLQGELQGALSRVQRHRMSRLQRQLSQQQEDASCTVCLTHRRTVVLLPCRHMPICPECYRGLASRLCPICRAAIRDHVVVFA